MATNNEKIRGWFRLLWPIAVALILVAVAYGTLNQRVKAVEIKVKKAEDTRERVIRMEEGIEYLKKAVDRIEKKLEK